MQPRPAADSLLFATVAVGLTRDTKIKTTRTAAAAVFSLLLLGIVTLRVLNTNKPALSNG